MSISIAFQTRNLFSQDILRCSN